MFQLPENPNTKGHHLKQQKEHRRVDARKQLLRQRVINDWNRLPEKTVSSIFTILQFKTGLKFFWVIKGEFPFTQVAFCNPPSTIYQMLYSEDVKGEGEEWCGASLNFQWRFFH